MEDIDTIIKKRQEKKKLEEDTDLAIKEKDKVIGQMVGERRNLEKLRKDRENFVKDREIEMKQKFLELENKMVKIQQDLGKLEEVGNEVALDIENTMKMAVQRELSLINKADGLVEQSEWLKGQAEATIEVLNTIKKNLDEKVMKNSELEKEVSNREKVVEIKNQKADQKLKEAKELAFWHKEPGAKYPEK